MFRAESSIDIAKNNREVLEWILDLDRYRLADTKIAAISHQPEIDENNTTGRARYRGRLRGLPTPFQWQTVSLTPWTQLDFATAPGQWTARLAQFAGGFVCEPIDDGTRLTHYEQFTFLSPVNRLFDPALRTWMERYLVDQELPELKRLIEAT